MPENAILVTVKDKAKRSKFCDHKGYNMQQHDTCPKFRNWSVSDRKWSVSDRKWTASAWSGHLVTGGGQLVTGSGQSVPGSGQ